MKLAASRPSSSSLAGVDAVAEVLRARDLFRGAGQAAHRHERGARDEQPERRRERDAAEADDREHQLAGAPSVLSTSVSGSATCHTPLPSGARSVSTRTCVPATVASLKNAAAGPRRRRASRR